MKWSIPEIIQSELTDGSMVYGVYISGEQDVEIYCISYQAAEKLRAVLEECMDIEIY